MFKYHKPHKKLVILYTASDKKSVETRAMVKLVYFKYDMVNPRYEEIIHYDKIENTILNLPEEGDEDRRISSGNVFKV